MNYEEMIKAAENLDEALLYCGLTVMCRKLAENIPKIDDFDEPIREALKEDRTAGLSPFWDKGWEDVSKEFSYARGALPAVLFTEFIRHEWLEGPGKRLFEKFKRKFKEVICGKDGPYEQFNNKLVGQAQLPATIVASILATGISAAWVPCCW